MIRVTVRGAGKFLAFQVALILAIAIVVPMQASGTESRPEVYYGNTVVGLDFINSGMSQDLLHRSTLATSDREAIAISFPGDPAPAIAQTSSTTIAASSLGLFVSNFQFSPVINVGAAPVGVGQFMAPIPVTTAKFSGHSLMFPEMTVEGNLRGNGSLEEMVNTGITLPPSGATNAYDKVRGLSYLEENQSTRGFEAREKGLPVILSGHTIDFVSSPEAINNTTIVDRLWRNSHQANALNYLYEGEAARPAWIAPVKNPLLLIDCGDMFDAIKCARELTRPGTFLRRAYWPL